METEKRRDAARRQIWAEEAYEKIWCEENDKAYKALTKSEIESIIDGMLEDDDRVEED